MQTSHRSWRQARYLDPDAAYPGIRYAMLHSFAHALMRQFALECGYTSASLRERIYARGPNEPHGPMAGILIYTAAPDSEGTLGMYGKVMSIRDLVMGKYYRLATRFSPHEIETLEKEMETGSLHPRDAKMRLAREINSIFYGDEDANLAQEAFVKTFQQKEAPDEMPEYHVKENETVLDVILAAGLAESKSKARALIDQKGVRLDGETLERGDAVFPHPGILQVGKRRFLRVL